MVGSTSGRRDGGRGPGRRPAWTALPLAVAGLGLLAVAAVAQGAPQATDPAVSTVSLGTDLVAAREAHLWRVTAWGGANLLMGIGLMAATDFSLQPGWRGFGIQAAAWGAINLGIVAWAFAAGFDAPAGTLAGALAAEDAYGNILLVNLGLNVGYMAVGAALAFASGHGIAHGRTVRGHGLGLVFQGLGLLALDWVAYAGSRGRMEALQALVERVSTGGALGL